MNRNLGHQFDSFAGIVNRLQSQTRYNAQHDPDNGKTARHGERAALALGVPGYAPPHWGDRTS